MSSTSLIDSFEETLIPVGGIGISKEKNVLKTFVGSCIALCIYDIEKKIGGMAHIMLPKNTSKNFFPLFVLCKQTRKY